MNINEKVLNKNLDVIERLKKEDIDYKYLENDDVLLLHLKNYNFNTSDSIELMDGMIIVHFDSETYKIMGFTLPYVKEFQAWVKSLTGNKRPLKKIEPIQIGASFFNSFAFS